MSDTPNTSNIYTDNQLVVAVANALADSNIEAVEAIMLVLAGQNPRLAHEVYDTMKLGVVYAKAIAKTWEGSDE